MFLEILSVEAFTEKYLYLEGLSDVAYKPMQAPIKPPERFVLRLTAVSYTHLTLPTKLEV